MSSFEDRWHTHFVPECFFDTVLLKALLQTSKRVRHKKGCNNVLNELESERLRDDFAVALIDRDKREPYYLKSCSIYFDNDRLRLWKHSMKQQFIIQLNPPLEKWIIEILEEADLKIESFGYPKDFKLLKSKIKNDMDNETDAKLNKLVKAIIDTNCKTIKKMKAILIYLKEKNYEADINELKNV
jgi:hypothetical protein